MPRRIKAFEEKQARSHAIRFALLAAVWVALGYGVLAGASRQTSDGSVDEASLELGRQAYQQACVQCHGPNQASIQRKPVDDWRRTVYSMIGRGAPVLPDEIEPLTMYLTSIYGPTSPPPTLGDRREEATLPDGGETIMAACAACHAIDLILRSRKSESEWRETLERMGSLGAIITDAERQRIVAYLSRHFGLE